MVDLHESEGDMDGFGIWESLEAFCPPPAVQEVRLALGAMFLDKNQNLWEEVKALYHVLALCGGDRALSARPRPSSKRTSCCEASTSHIDNEKTPGNNARSMSSSSNSSGGRCQTIISPSHGNRYTVSALIQAVCNHDIDDDFSITIKAVKSAIYEENLELENKVIMLNEVIAGEAESMATRYPAPNNKPAQPNKSAKPIDSAVGVRICSYCSRESYFDESCPPVKVSYTCALCKDAERREKKLALSKLTTMPAYGSKEELSSSIDTDSVSSSINQKPGKFRSRLQSARDDIFFFED